MVRRRDPPIAAADPCCPRSPTVEPAESILAISITEKGRKTLAAAARPRSGFWPWRKRRASLRGTFRTRHTTAALAACSCPGLAHGHAQLEGKLQRRCGRLFRHDRGTEPSRPAALGLRRRQDGDRAGRQLRPPCVPIVLDARAQGPAPGHPAPAAEVTTQRRNCRPHQTAAGSIGASTDAASRSCWWAMRSSGRPRGLWYLPRLPSVAISPCAWLRANLRRGHLTPLPGVAFPARAYAPDHCHRRTPGVFPPPVQAPR